jgi:hypothetical protein
MAIEPVVTNLLRKIEALREALLGLALTAIEDRPTSGEVLLVERLGDIVEDLRGLCEEMSEAANRARDAIADPADFNLGRRALASANERFIRLEYRFFGEGAAHHTIAELQRFGRERGREWLSWSGGAIQALESCRPPVRELDEAFLETWRELGERFGDRSVSVNATAIGQQIAGKPPQRGDSRSERRKVADGLTGLHAND